MKNLVIVVVLIITTFAIYQKFNIKSLNEKETISFLENLLKDDKFGDKSYFYEYNIKNNVLIIQDTFKIWNKKKYKLSKTDYDLYIIKEKDNDSNFGLDNNKIKFNFLSCSVGSFVLKKEALILENDCYNYFLTRKEKYEFIKL